MGVSVTGYFIFWGLSLSVSLETFVVMSLVVPPFHGNLRSPACYWGFAKPNMENLPHCAFVIEARIGISAPVLGAKPKEQ
jgi:hypothetical protein